MGHLPKHRIPAVGRGAEWWWSLRAERTWSSRRAQPISNYRRWGRLSPEGFGDEPDPKHCNSMIGLLELAGRTGHEDRQNQPKMNRPWAGERLPAFLPTQAGTLVATPERGFCRKPEPGSDLILQPCLPLGSLLTPKCEVWTTTRTSKWLFENYLN